MMKNLIANFTKCYHWQVLAVPWVSLADSKFYVEHDALDHFVQKWQEIPNHFVQSWQETRQEIGRYPQLHLQIKCRRIVDRLRLYLIYLDWFSTKLRNALTTCSTSENAVLAVKGWTIELQLDNCFLTANCLDCVWIMSVLQLHDFCG